MLLSPSGSYVGQAYSPSSTVVEFGPNALLPWGLYYLCCEGGVGGLCTDVSGIDDAAVDYLGCTVRPSEHHSVADNRQRQIDLLFSTKLRRKQTGM